MKRETFNDYERAVAAFQLLSPHLGRLADDAHAQVARGLVERLAHFIDAEITRLSVEASRRLVVAMGAKPCGCHEQEGGGVFGSFGAPELRAKLGQIPPQDIADLVDSVIGRPGFSREVMGLGDRYGDVVEGLLTDEGLSDFLARLSEAVDRHEASRDEADAGAMAAEHDDREAGN